MADKLTNLNIGVNLDSSKAKKGVKSLKNEIKQTSKAGSQSVGGLGGSFSNLALKVGGAVAVFGTLSAGIKKVIALQGEQERAEKSLEVALGGVSNKLLAQASAFQEMSTFGDEAILGVMASIGAFEKNEDAITKLTQSTLDLATATGMDLKSAGDLIAKTVGSSTNALSRYGIAVDGAVGSTDRLESLTRNVAKLYGGQAKAQTDTMAGSLQQMTNAIGDAGEAFGELLAPTVITVAKGIKVLSEGIGSIVDDFRKLTHMEEKTFIVTNDLDKQQQEFTRQMENSAGSITKLRDLYSSLYDQQVKLIGSSGQILDNQLFAQIGEQLKQVQETAENVSEDDILTEMTIRQMDASDKQLIKEQENNRASLEGKKVKLAEDIQITQAQRDAEIQSATKHAEDMAKLDAIQLQSKTRLVSGLLGALSTLAGQRKDGAKTAKRFAQIQAIIDTFSAGNVALKSYPPPFGAIAMATTIAQGYANVQAIESQNFATGGTVKGRGGVDTIPANLTAGEYVINRTSARAIGVDNLNKLNRQGFYNGGMVGGVDVDSIVPSSMQTVNISGNVLTDDFYKDYIRPAISRNEGLNLA